MNQSHFAKFKQLRGTEVSWMPRMTGSDNPDDSSVELSDEQITRCRRAIPRNTSYIHTRKSILRRICKKVSNPFD